MRAARGPRSFACKPAPTAGSKLRDVERSICGTARIPNYAGRCRIRRSERLGSNQDSGSPSAVVRFPVPRFFSVSLKFIFPRNRTSGNLSTLTALERTFPDEAPHGYLLLRSNGEIREYSRVPPLGAARRPGSKTTRREEDLV